MGEWGRVDARNYTDPISGELISLKLLHRPEEFSAQKSISIVGKDLDQIALNELDSYEEIMRLAEANSVVLSEYDFNLQNIQKMVIPK